MTSKEFKRVLEDFSLLSPDAQSQAVDTIFERSFEDLEDCHRPYPAVLAFFEGIFDHCSDLNVASVARGALLRLQCKVEDNANSS